MAQDSRKRQKKLEKQKAKKKAEKKAAARRESLGFAVRFQAAATAPLLHCCMMKDIMEKGIGQVLVSRILPNTTVAFSVFIVDTYCLGVKDAYFGFRSRLEYEEKLHGGIHRQFDMVDVKLEYALKLVEASVQYAQSIGLPPNSEYHTAKLLFGDTSAESCTEQFVFGKDGMPLFIAGPKDNEYRCQHILKTMETHCGPGKYHYILPVGDHAMGRPIANDDDEYEDDFDDDYEDDAEEDAEEDFEKPSGGIIHFGKDGMHYTP